MQHDRFRSRVVALAFGLIACRPSAGPTEVMAEVEPAEPSRPIEVPAPVWAPLPSTIRWPAGALAIELPPGEPAPWLLPPFEPGHGHPLDRLEVVAHGERIALARSGELLLATERDEGLLGTIALPPEIGWIGVGGGDRIFAADSHGRLFAAETIAQALAEGFRPTGAVLGQVTTWDAAGERVLAVVGSAVMVSEDGGRSFRSTEPARGVTVETAVVRADGLMVALVEAKRTTTYVSRDGGRRWQRSSWQPESLWREDAWILGAGPTEVGVLSSDGRSWVGNADRFTAFANYRSWNSDYFYSGGPEPGMGKWLTPTDPPAPPPPARPLRGRSRRDAFMEGGVPGGVLGGVLGGLIGGVAPCKSGLVCLHGNIGDAPASSRLDARVFGDARCEVEATRCPSESWRPPHIGVFDHATNRLRLGRLPHACTEVDMAQARGLALVRCEHESKASLIVVAPDGIVHTELEVSDAKPDVSYVMMAEDGTMLVPEIPTCDRWARAWVRRPVAPGAPEAWTRLEVPGARTWRPVGRGYAVAVADHPGGRANSADLWLAGPGLDEPKRVLEGIPVLVGVTDVRVDDGRVSLHADRWLVVRRDASLTEVELPSRERVVDGVTVTRAVPWLACAESPMHLE